MHGKTIENKFLKNIIIIIIFNIEYIIFHVKI